MTSAEKLVIRDRLSQPVDHEANWDFIMDLGQQIKEGRQLTETVTLSADPDKDETFSFGGFQRMQEELDFKGNFYERVKRKSLVVRE
jgi:hypothetical protein